MLIKFLLSLILFFSPITAQAAFQCDGTDDGLTTSASPGFDKIHTISSWVRVTNFSNYRNLYADGVGGSWTLRFDQTTGYTNVDRNSVQNAYTSSTTAITADTWTQVTTTYDTNGAYVVYHGGTSVKSGTNNLTPNNFSTLKLCHHSDSETTHPYIGYFTEFARRSVALSAYEVETIAKSQVKYMDLQIQPTTLLVYYTMDEIADGTAANGLTYTDRSASGATLTASDGANNTGATASAEYVMSYP